MVMFILTNVLLPDGSWFAFGLSWGCILGVVALSKLSLGTVLHRSFIALPFVIAAITVIFNFPGEPVLSFVLFTKLVVITDNGLIRFGSVLLRSWISVQAGILLISTTRFPDLIHALRHLKLPQVVTSIIAFMYRFLFVLLDEAIRLLRGRDSRSARLQNQSGGGSIPWRARVAGNMAGQLFLRSYERSEHVYQAMLARGYQGEYLTINPHTISATDWNAFILAIIILFSIQLVGILSV